MKKMSQVLLLAAVVAWLAAPSAASGLTAHDSLASPAQALEAAELLAGVIIGPIGPGGEQCGDVICGKGTVCCNPTCNLCLPPDMSCTQEVCTGTETAAEPDFLADPAEPAPNLSPDVSPNISQKSLEMPEPVDLGPPVEPCNQVVCGPGFYCCNFSCSICAPDGGFCTQQVCE
jgi:hypothetical protein